MNTAIDRVQNNAKAAIQKFINHVEESEMKSTTKNTERSNRFTGHISMNTPTKLLAGLALGVMLTWAGISSFNASADEPKTQVVTAQQQPVQAQIQLPNVLPGNTFTDLEKLVIQAEMEDGFGETRSTFTAEELLVIQAEIEDAYVQPRNSFTAEELLVIQAEIEDAYVQPRNTFTAEELLVIQAEIEDAYVQPRNTFTAEELLVIQAEIEDAYVQPRSTFTDLEKLVIQAEMEDGFGETRNTFTDLEKLVIQAEMEDGFGETRSTFTDLEKLVIQAEMEDGFGGAVTSPTRQVDMSHAGGDRSVLQALQSHDVGSVFSAEEWLQILSEIEDTV